MDNKLKIGIVSAVIIVLGIAAYGIYANTEKDNFIKEKEVNLSASDRKIFEDRLTALMEQEKTAQSDEDKFGIYIQQGYNLQSLGKLAEAQAAFDKAIEIKPDDFIGYAVMTQIQLDRGDNEGARSSIKTAIGKNPANADLWKKYIQIEIERFNASNDTINGLYVEALGKTSSHIDMTTSYADWLEKAGNLQAAKEYWQQAGVINPNGKKIYDAEIKRLDALMKQ